MNPSRIFILRPVATSLIMAAVLLLGAVAFNFLPLSALPEVDYPTIEVETFYPGASPEVMTSSVTAPLERQFGQMPGLKQMSSVSSAGSSLLTLQFDLSLNLDIAEQEVQAAINAAGNLLPSDLPAPPIYAKVNPADAPVLTIAVTSKTLKLTEVEDLADTRIAQKISQQPGVGLVSLSGGERPAVRVEINPEALAAHKLNIDDVRTIISNANVNAPKGSFDGPLRSTTINANDQLKSADEYKSIIVAFTNGSPIRLGDIATIKESAENTKLGAWVGQEGSVIPAIIINVQRQPGSNVIAVADTIQKLLPALKASLPAALDVSVVTDRTTTIRASVHDVELELSLAVMLVVCVIFAFLGTWRATIIPSLSVPLSIIGTFCIMYLFSFSLNNLTLMALTIATGFVVDDAIVMIENITRYFELGENPRDAALKGSKEIGFTIVSLTISLIAVLIPLLFMKDVVGRLFQEFAITLSVTILFSALVSLTLVPMLCSKILKPIPSRSDQSPHAQSHAWFDRLLSLYTQALTYILNHERLTLIVAIATLVMTVLLYIAIPKGFFPLQDTGLIQGISVAPESTSYKAMVEQQVSLAETILKDPDVISLSSFIGVDGTNVTLNKGRFLINLKPKASRHGTLAEIIERLSKATLTQPGVTLYLQPVQDLTIDTSVSETSYQFMVEDANTKELAEWVPKLSERLKQSPILKDVSHNLQQSGLAYYVNVDRNTASRLGITLATIDNALYDAFGQRIVSTIFTESNQYRVILGTLPDKVSLDSIYLPSAQGGQVPLSTLATITEENVPLQINHLGQFPAAMISFNVAPGQSLGDAVSAIESIESELAPPLSLMTVFQGSSQAFKNTLGSEVLLIVAAIITVYIVLGVLYESYIHPITILSTLPSAGIGALLALMLSGHNLDIIAIIGIILLIGIVKKNAIMMIDFALLAERIEKKPPREAIFQAALLRFRPIMMTTMAALLGAFPLMIGSGVGSELRHPLGIAIVGGLVVSQMLTLFTTPVIYLAFDRLARRLGWFQASPSPDGKA